MKYANREIGVPRRAKPIRGDFEFSPSWGAASSAPTVADARKRSRKLKRALRLLQRPFFLPCSLCGYARLVVNAAGLEQELQAELEDAAQVGAGGLQEAGPAAGGAGWIARGIIGATVTGDRAVYAVPLGVIENVESLGAELERVGLLDGEILV